MAACTTIRGIWRICLCLFPTRWQEFKVETSSLTAQNGVHAGGTITGITRSGSNAFHGDAFEFLRNGDMNARNFFAPARDTLKRNQFGGTIGGPVIKNKLFFFFGYQDTITRQDPLANTSATFVPTAAMIAGNFSACPQDLSATVLAGLPPSISGQIHNNQIPVSLFDPAALKLAALLPATTWRLRHRRLRAGDRDQRESVCRPRRLPNQHEE